MKGWKENDKRIGLIARVIRNGSNGEMKLEIIVQIHNATIEVSPPPPPLPLMKLHATISFNR